MILAQAVRAGASDIHIEPYRDVSACASGWTACSMSAIP